MDKKIIEDIGSHYKLEGDNFWYVRNVGGKDAPLLNIGGGSHPDPRPINAHYGKTENSGSKGSMSLLERMARKEARFLHYSRQEPK